MNIILVLPWPSKELSQNSRSHWAKKSKAVQAARGEAFYLTRTEYAPGPQPERVNVSIHFYPPTARRYDLDNLHGRCKSYQDGIFQALGWDDRIIQRIDLSMCGQRPGGCVEYRIDIVG